MYSFNHIRAATMITTVKINLQENSFSKTQKLYLIMETNLLPRFKMTITLEFQIPVSDPSFKIGEKQKTL